MRKLLVVAAVALAAACGGAAALPEDDPATVLDERCFAEKVREKYGDDKPENASVEFIRRASAACV